MQISASELKEKLEKKEDIFLLDVRTPEEYKNWNIEGSLNIPLQELHQNIDRIPINKEIITICAHGIRSARAAETLTSIELNAKSIKGGMAAWNAIFDVVPLIEKDFVLHQIKRIGKGCSGYILVSGNSAAVIDPTTRTQEYIKIAADLGSEIKVVIDTHQHADHISGAKLLRDATNANFFLNPLDGYKLQGYNEMKDKDIITIGDIEIEVLHTPGHTKGSTSLLVNGKVLLTGDILFTDGIARPDLKDQADEYAEELYDTYHNRILNLKDSILIAPAHYKSSLNFGVAVVKALDSIKKNNRVFELSKTEFVKYVTTNIPSKPFNYEQIIKANKGELDLTEEEIADLEFGANKCVLSTE